MHRPRQVFPYVVFFLAFLLHCAEVCLGTGRTPGTATMPAATQSGPEQGRCHFPHAFPQETPKACAGCAGHVFLALIPPDTATLAASESALSSLCLRTPLLAFPVRE